MSLRINASTFNSQHIPKFTYNEYNTLKRLPIPFPEGTNTLRDRVQEFQALPEKLSEVRQSRLAVSAVLVAIATALAAGEVFGFASGLLPVGFACVLVLFIVGCCAALYFRHSDKKFHCLQERHQKLSEQLTKEIPQAAQFWKQYGNELWLQADNDSRMAREIDNCLRNGIAATWMPGMTF